MTGTATTVRTAAVLAVAVPIAEEDPAAAEAVPIAEAASVEVVADPTAEEDPAAALVVAAVEEGAEEAATVSSQQSQR